MTQKIIANIVLLSLFSACNFNSTKKSDSLVDSITQQIKENPNNASLYYNRGVEYHKIKADSLAVLDYVKAVELDSSKAQYYSAVADLLFIMKDVRSIEYINKALKLNPNDKIAHLKVATIQFYSKNYTAAFASINTVLRTDVYNYDAYFLKGMCFKDMGDTANAISSFQTAAKMTEKPADAYLQLGIISSNKDIKQAILYFENAYKADSNNVEPLNGIGLIYQERKELEKAKQAFTRCIMAKPSFAKAFYNMGCVLMDQDSIEKAQRNFNIAVQHDPQYIEAFYNRGLCKELLKDTKGALQDYEQALLINPDFQLAIAAKKRLP